MSLGDQKTRRIALRTGVPSPRRFLGRISFVRLLGLVIYCRDGRKWGAGLWNERRPFELSFDDFDETTFEVNNKDALSSLDQV